MSAVAKIGAASRPVPKTPRAPRADVLSILDRMSIDPAISDDRVKARMAYEEEIRKDTARRAYDQAMTAMQPDLPEIAENGKIIGPDGTVKHTYAEWEDIAEALRPVLTMHGFNLTFRCQPGPRQVEITAVCAHDEGHREEATVPMIIDLSDSKNDNQGMKSATSYGKRAAATLLLNIITRGEDDDGQKSVVSDREPRISDDQARRIRDALASFGCQEDKLLPVLKVKSLAELPAARFDETITLINQLGRRPILRPQEPK